MASESEADLRSRRMLLAGGAAASAALLAACGAKPLRIRVRSGAAVSPADVQALNSLLDVERYAVAAYTAGIPLLRPVEAKTASWFLSQELAHIAQLSELIQRGHGKVQRPRANYDLGHPHDQDGVLALFRRVEQAQMNGYLSIIPRLSNGKLRSTAAAILANEAQHLAVLRVQSGQAAVPTAFAVG
jgi:Ferritin-like domain